MRPVLPAALLAASVLLFSPAVQARDNHQPADPQADALAKKHVQKATDAFRAHRYDEALAEFEAGYAAVPRPAFVLNMGHVARDAGYKARARAYYTRYLELEPGSPQREQVEKAIAEIDASQAAGGGARRSSVASASAAGVDSEVPADLKLTAREPIRSQSDEQPGVFRQWWFWGVVAGVIAAGALTFFVLRSSGDDYTTSGTWGTLGR